MKAAVHIGTSGWHYPHWRGPFYPEKLPAARMLEHYTGFFDTVELNNTFYRLPSESAVLQWREGTPKGFCFALKGSRFLTHMKKLKDPAPGIEKFFSRADLLGKKLGPVVFQLPPWWEVNAARLEGFLEALPPRHRYAFELRNPTWHTEEIFRILRRHNTAFCIFELAGVQSGLRLTANHIYVRLHGPGGPYQGSYPEKTLAGWEARIRAWMPDHRAIYIYFDNDEAGFAVKNALRLKQRLTSAQ